MRRPELAFGEGYVDNAIEVSGDLPRMMASINLALTATEARQTRRRPIRPSRPVVASARENIHRHYDLGNEFFRLWLDPAMVYTCAYYEHPVMELEQAQQAKLEYICRKVRLRAGDRVIETGSGWGALAIHMARHHGALVRAYNISEEQLAYAREEAVRQGVADRVTFINGDFRSVTGECDVFVSIGMLEHIGAAEYGTLGEIIDRTIHSERGRGLLHFIGRNRPAPVNEWTRRYIFPGTYVPVISEVTSAVFEPWNISVVDVENLRLHYAATLRDWRERFERASDRVAEMFDDRFVRMWRLYLACAEAAFTSGDHELFQMTFGRAADNDVRWTRADLYAGQPGPPSPYAEADRAVM